jgi:hypothetical protein
MARYAITIFLSAFLLFQVQPMIGKVILPWYGGGPAVWTACMLFFQVFLLAGYAYAHLVASRLTPRVGTSVHWALLVASLLLLPIAPNEEVWKQATETAPVAQIVALLAVTIGLPYFLLSSTGPLLQESFRRETGHPPYRLYALSNVGSLLALLTYPFVFEPQLTLRVQTWSWSGAYIAFATLSAWCVLGLMRHAAGKTDGLLPTGNESGKPARVTPPPWRDIALWLALAACGSVLLLATTNQLCQEVTTVPFLWVVPLALYLTTFVICFDHERWYHRPTFLLLLIAALFAASYAMFEGTSLKLWIQVAAYCGTLWVCCMVCHGELVRSKPAPQYATLFYLLVAAGGALGGVLVAVVAPLVLPDYWEYQIALCATVVLAFWTTNRESAPETKKPISVWIAGAGFLTAVALGIIGFMATTQAAADMNESNLETTRNFYGVLRVNKSENIGDAKGPYVELIHGRIRHGAQYLEAPLNRQPVTYYGAGTGISLALDFHPKRAASHSLGIADARPTDEQRRPGTLRIGVIGLGCGTLATYGQPGDTMRFYDINPEVVRIAQEYFTYCKDSAATVDILLGDARINLERELAAGHPQKFDVLAVDAFSSDSIPMHLLTKECVELYRQHLAPDGLLCLHLSNQFLDLNGVARGMAEVLGVECVRVISNGDYKEGLDATTWVILTNNREFLDSPELAAAIDPWTDDDPAPLVWTDDYGSLWQVLDD